MTRPPLPPSSPENAPEFVQVRAPISVQGVTEEMLAAKVAGGTVLRIKRTGINPQTRAPVISDALCFIPEA